MWVKQGDVLSPFLFPCFVNDIPMTLVPTRIEITSFLYWMKHCYTLFYLRTTLCYLGRLQNLFKFCWIDCTCIVVSGIKNVNKSKTEIVVFRNGWQPVIHKWYMYFDNEELKFVNSFVYLAVLLNYNDKFQSTQKRVAQQGERAFSL